MVGLLGFVALGARLTDLAVLSPGAPAKPRYVADPMENQTRRVDITDRNGRLIATDYPKISVFADPKEVIDPKETADALTTVLANLDADKLGERLVAQQFAFRLGEAPY